MKTSLENFNNDDNFPSYFFWVYISILYLINYNYECTGNIFEKLKILLIILDWVLLCMHNCKHLYEHDIIYLNTGCRRRIFWGGMIAAELLEVYGDGPNELNKCMKLSTAFTSPETPRVNVLGVCMYFFFVILL